MTPRALDVYVVPRKGRPIKTDEKVTGKYPSTITYIGQVYHFAGADLTNHTITYTETAPPPPV